MSSYDPHGYLVIYSSADRSSFTLSETILQSLWRSENIAQKAVILVGNKADLARSRVVSSEGECHHQDCHFLFFTCCWLKQRENKCFNKAMTNELNLLDCYNFRSFFFFFVLNLLFFYEGS